MHCFSLTKGTFRSFRGMLAPPLFFVTPQPTIYQKRNKIILKNNTPGCFLKLLSNFFHTYLVNSKNFGFLNQNNFLNITKNLTKMDVIFRQRPGAHKKKFIVFFHIQKVCQTLKNRPHPHRVTWCIV